jgi:DNA-binding protein H-NS
MTTKRKRWSDMTTQELADATHKFDDPKYNPPARKVTKQQLAQLRRVKRKAAQNRFSIALALEANLIEQADEYAAKHGITFSELVSDALRRLIGKKSA